MTIQKNNAMRTRICLRTLPILIALLLFGFVPKKQSFLEVVFYGIPLDESKVAIYNFLKNDPDRFTITSDTSSWLMKDVSAKVKTIHHFKNRADSASIEMSPSWVSMCDGRRMRVMSLN